ncbi:MAG: translesion error-prone DNA polymerase V autoproteolytic subunit [Paludibacter sp.]|jgi:DNA polymerase V|nr:translesion error-prone DNA polymerase V autoproteolytic subunit [Paludibacter sp.]MBP8782836.1 translesion error-prone DNA polymerase V autoproteolytic subunit [Paludibacter sp.]
MTALQLHSSAHLDIYSAQTDTELNLPLFEGVRAGFPSPAADFIDVSIDLNKHLIKHPSATFYARAKGDSMKDAGIFDGDLLIVDKSIDPADGKIAICYVNGEFTVKRIKKDKDEVWLIPANTAYQPIKMEEGSSLTIWGIVTHVIKSL